MKRQSRRGSLHVSASEKVSWAFHVLPGPISLNPVKTNVHTYKTERNKGAHMYVYFKIFYIYILYLYKLNSSLKSRPDATSIHAQKQT
jgi:hypothetical protein